jgi:hypothetical protein
VQQLLAKRFVVAGHSGFFADDFERNNLLRTLVVSGEDLAHAPFSEALADLVAVVDDRTVR